MDYSACSTNATPLPRTLLASAVSQLALAAAGVVTASLMLKSTINLGWRGIGVALCCYLVLAALVMRGLGRHPYERLGAGNAVTLVRGAMTALFFGIIGDAALSGTLTFDAGVRWILTVSAVVALVLDGIDGWLARRNGMASDFGAQFDMETDALLMLAIVAGLRGRRDRWLGDIERIAALPIRPCWVVVDAARRTTSSLVASKDDLRRPDGAPGRSARSGSTGGSGSCAVPLRFGAPHLFVWCRLHLAAAKNLPGTSANENGMKQSARRAERGF